ncbi:MAG: FAD-binding protein, partial [bacterium]
KELIQERLPQIHELALHFAGVDCFREPIPIQPTAHYSMGGIPVDVDCHVIKDAALEKAIGLYAAGECSCVSVHGANRLGTNSLLEAVLFGRKAGRSVNNDLKLIEWTDLPHNPREEAQAEIDRLIHSQGKERIADIRLALQESMTRRCGVFRNEQDLKAQLDFIRELQERFRHISIDDKGAIFNTELMEALELGHLLEFSEVIVAGALERKESRGAHYRKDYPTRDDDQWLKHTLAWRKPEGGVTFDWRKVIITRFPPKERVY